MSDQRRRIMAVSGIAILIAILAVGAVFLFQGDDDDEPAAEQVTLELYVHPDVADAAGESELLAVVEATLDESLGEGRASVVLVDSPFAERFIERLRALEEEVGYVAAVADLQAKLRGDRIADADAYQAAVDDALQAAKRAEDAVTERLEEDGPLLQLAAGRLGVDITPARAYGASRIAKERWFRVEGGVAMELHDDPARLRQSIANHVVRGLGLIAGLPPRPGSPDEAMALGLDPASGDHDDRDSGPVRFDADELRAVREALGALSVSPAS